MRVVIPLSRSVAGEGRVRVLKALKSSCDLHPHPAANCPQIHRRPLPACAFGLWPQPRERQEESSPLARSVADLTPGPFLSWEGSRSLRVRLVILLSRSVAGEKTQIPLSRFVAGEG